MIRVPADPDCTGGTSDAREFADFKRRLNDEGLEFGSYSETVGEWDHYHAVSQDEYGPTHPDCDDHGAEYL
jgi:hypothetical protein